MNTIKKAVIAIIAALSVGSLSVPANAAIHDYGVDWSVYQGANGLFGYGHDKFAVSQIGGYSGGIYDQWTYNTQVASGIAQGKHMHTYIWWEGVTDYATADQVLNHFLPKLQTPKGSIVALDVESGAQNTDVIMHALQRIKDAGYTPMVYGYKNYLLANTDLHRIAASYQLWLAEYPDYNVTTEPNFNFFPSFENVGILQFTSTYIGGGLDGDYDLSGVTSNGYNGETPKSNTSAIAAGVQADNTPKADVKVGDTVKVNFSANTWSTGETIPAYIKGHTYKVAAVDGTRFLLDGVNSWINKKDAEVIATEKSVQINGVFVLDEWVREFGKWYGRNYDMAIPVADYNNDIPASEITMTDKYGNALADQSIHGNDGHVEYFTLNGNYKVLEQDCSSIKVEIAGEPVWLKVSYTTNI
ncbi:GH25 family lysozyme [Weissella confusa]|uniref:GH25 family lysozyme n=1 Tax=Weissella confusa TaxID=1583 RepID=UPI0021B032FD|nr:GH25 family lysozyme [Weissella confusa]MCS9991250.1 lysin [Weissella confusa]